MKIDERYPWYLFDLFVFVLLNYVFLSVIKPHMDFLQNLTIMQIILLGLAVYRIANVIANETITKPLRAPFVLEKKSKHEGEEVPKKGALGTFGSLIYCPSCTGVWIAAILVYSYALWPGESSFVILIFAVSALERFFTESIGRIRK